MENKDSQMIRNYMNLMESIENKLLSDKVIIENEEVQTINEFNRTWIKTFSGDAKALKSAEPALHDAFIDVLSFAKTDKNQIKGLTKSSPNKFVNITNIDDLLYALKTESGMLDSTLALFNQGLLKSSKTPANLINDISKEVVSSNSFIKNYGGMTPKEMEIALKNEKYSDNAIKSLMENSKKDKKFMSSRKKGIEKRKLKKTQSGKDKNLKTKTNGGAVRPAQKTTLIKRAQELLDGVKNKKWNWKKVLAWGASIGVGTLALWWALHDRSEIVPDDLPENEPMPDGEWASCIQNLINNKSGVVSTSSSGEISVVVTKTGNEEYDKLGGVQFYSNGRVMLRGNGKMGSWTCKDGEAVIKEMSLNEQTNSEIDSDVETMIDLLDFPVTSDDMQDALVILKKYSTSPKGKEFLQSYKEAGYGRGSLKKSISYITTTKASSARAKREMSSLLSQIESGKTSPTPTITANPTTGGGIGGINITWDGEKTAEPVTPDVKSSEGTKKKSLFSACNKFPYTRGCKSSIIKEVQICFGFPKKWQTGNFGPITLNKLQELYSTSEINEDTYNRIKEKCKPSSAASTTGTTTPSVETSGNTSPNVTKTNNTEPTNANNSENLNLTKSECVDLFREINDRDQSSAGKTATDTDIIKCKNCLQQYNFGIAQGAVRIKKRYGLNAAGGDKGIR